MKQLLQKHLQPLTERHPALLGVATATAGFFRSIAIKPYKQRHRPRELALWERYHSLHAVRCQVYREKGAGGRPTIDRFEEKVTQGEVEAAVAAASAQLGLAVREFMVGPDIADRRDGG